MHTTLTILRHGILFSAMWCPGNYVILLHTLKYCGKPAKRILETTLWLIMSVIYDKCKFITLNFHGLIIFIKITSTYHSKQWLEWHLSESHGQIFTRMWESKNLLINEKMVKANPLMMKHLFYIQKVNVLVRKRHTNLWTENMGSFKTSGLIIATVDNYNTNIQGNNSNSFRVSSFFLKAVNNSVVSNPSIESQSKLLFQGKSFLFTDWET